MSAKEPLPPVRGERVAERRRRAVGLLEALHAAYPETGVALHHDSPFQLLVAVILSAQCTDERVNQVTPALFEAFPGPEQMATAPIEELERLVQPTGFFRQKARNIRATSELLVARHGGMVPPTIEELTQLPGAARKTANVVISSCFPEHAAGIAVDTHVQRIARRLGLSRSWTPGDVERDLMRLVPRDEWNHVTHLLIDHGREVCRAPVPRCDACPLAIAERCPSRGRWDAGASPPLRRARRTPG